MENLSKMEIFGGNTRAAVKRLSNELEQIKKMLGEDSGVFFEHDLTTKKIKCSSNFQLLFMENPVQDNFPHSAVESGAVHEEDSKNFLEMFGRVANGSPNEQMQIRIRRAGGIFIWCKLIVRTVLDENGMPLKAVGYIKNENFTDFLTGAKTKEKFEIDAHSRLSLENQVYALGHLNVSQFRIVNETFGEKIGDKLLEIVSSVFRSNLDNDELFARHYWDNFYFLAKYENDQLINARIDEMLHQIRSKFYKLINKPYKLDIFVGISVIAIGKTDLEEFIVKSNIALKNATKESSGHIIFYNETIADKILTDHNIENKMGHALKENQFKLYLQPKHSIKTEKVIGAEALVRWLDDQDDDQIIYPDNFIPLFERNGFVIKLDFYILNEVCKTLSDWIKNGIEPIRISVNFSKRHLDNLNFAEDVFKVVSMYDIPTSLIEVEFTEEIILHDSTLLKDCLNSLHGYGFTISMDDFGKGYSSLGLLKDIPFDIIKLDRSFLCGDFDSERGHKLFSSTIDMVHRMGMSTIVEGVETVEHIEILKQHNCDIAQGYYFARPMPAIVFKDYLDKNKI